MDTTQQKLLEFFKVMGHVDRLRVASTLMSQPYTVAALAEVLDQKPAAVLDHIAALRELGLVTAQGQNDQTAYTFDKQALFTMRRDLLSREALPTPVDGIEDPQVRRTLQNFFEGERLLSIPEGQKRFGMLIHWLVTCFEEGVRYTEQEVNEIIMRYHEDYATLRRGMIDAGLMQRDRGIYWRVNA